MGSPSFNHGVRMEALRENLAALSTTIPPLSHGPDGSARHAAIVAPNLLALLCNNGEDSSTSLLLLSLAPSLRAPASTRKHTLKLPVTVHAPDSILPAEGMFAIVGPSSVTVIDGLSTLNASTPPSPRPIAAPLFASRPALRVLHVAWSAAAPGFLMMLTSDGSLRMYDVLAPGPVDIERWRLRVVTAGARPVSFAFGRGSSWDSLAVYVLAEDGKVYVASPVAPIGTRIPRRAWLRMRKEAMSVIEKECRDPSTAEAQEEKTRRTLPGDPFATNPKRALTENNTPRRLLDFSGGANDDTTANGDVPTGDESWTLRQAQMQRRFLEHVFAPTQDGDMVATREFKPAPLLFQGPLYTDRDDLEDGEEISADIPEACKFRSLEILNCGVGCLPILLRSTAAGEVSVLIVMEDVEAQWFLSNDSFGSTGDVLLEANEEYSDCARVVGPLLLCFEHFSFGGDPVTLFPLGGKTDADVLYVTTSTSVHSVRLSFVPGFTDAATLESAPKSSTSLMLSASASGVEVGDAESRKCFVGLAPWYAKGEGPVALVVSSEGAVHATDPLRWITGLEKSWPSSLLSSGLSSDVTWSAERPLTGSRAFACPEYGKEMLELLHAVHTVQGEHGGRVVPGTLGKAEEAFSATAKLHHLEKRVMAFTGGEDGPGIGDNLKALADVLNEWSDKLLNRAAYDSNTSAELQNVLAEIERSRHTLQRKISRVMASNVTLGRRVLETVNMIQRGSSQLSVAELDRFKMLKNKKRRVVDIRNRLEELKSAVEARKKSLRNQAMPDTYASPSRRSLRSPVSGAQRSNRWTASPSWRDRESPVAKRRTEWSPQAERVDLTQKELAEIKKTLQKHSTEISAAMDVSSSLWKKLSAV